MDGFGKPEAYRTVRRQSRSHHLPAAHCLLLTPYSVTSPRLFTKRNAAAAGSTFINTRAFAFAVTNSAAEFASMGRGDFISWIAVGSGSRDRADAGWIDVVCD